MQARRLHHWFYDDVSFKLDYNSGVIYSQGDVK